MGCTGADRLLWQPSASRALEEASGKCVCPCHLLLLPGRHVVHSALLLWRPHCSSSVLGWKCSRKRPPPVSGDLFPSPVCLVPVCHIWSPPFGPRVLRSPVERGLKSAEMQPALPSGFHWYFQNSSSYNMKCVLSLLFPLAFSQEGLGVVHQKS